MRLALPVMLSAAIAFAPTAAVANRALPPFVATTSAVTARELAGSWRPGCPVPPAELREIRLSYIGFDGKRHIGGLVVNVAVVTPVERVFARLYAERFPILRMVPIARYSGNDYRSMAVDNTSGFNCRLAVANGPKMWSMHAYGEAIDVNPVQNPYNFDGHTLPQAGRQYTNRGNVRPGMAVPGGELVQAFTAIGWGWGGNWTGYPDYQHFSINGH
jgi:hypothetical protein